MKVESQETCAMTAQSRAGTGTLRQWRKNRLGRFLFDRALNHFHIRNGRVIVEIGTARKWSQQASTVIFSGQAKSFVTVDNDRRIHTQATNKMGQYSIWPICEDGAEFLSRYLAPIDLLYIDGPAPHAGDGTHGQVQALKQFNAAKLSTTSLILIDDCDLSPLWAGRGKGRWVIPAALDLGYHILADNGRQVLLG